MFVGGKTRHSQPKHVIRTLTKSFLCLNQKNLNSRPEALHFYNIKFENWSVKVCQSLCGLQERIVLTLILVMGLVLGIHCWGFLICTLGNLESCVETQFCASSSTLSRRALFHFTLYCMSSFHTQTSRLLHFLYTNIHTNTQDACSGNDSLSVWAGWGHLVHVRSVCGNYSAQLWWMPPETPLSRGCSNTRKC